MMKNSLIFCSKLFGDIDFKISPNVSVTSTSFLAKLFHGFPEGLTSIRFCLPFFHFNPLFQVHNLDIVSWLLEVPHSLSM